MASATVGWSARAQAPEASSPLAPLAFLAGDCWKGPFPDGKRYDEHCFEWFYDGQFLRDRHVVTGDERGYRGETIYYWDPAARQVHYIYFAAAGGVSRGSMHPDDGALRFPEERYIGAGGKEEVYRSVWRPAGGDTYDVVTEALLDGQWVEAWRIHMQRLPR
ncbi:MAG TPA: hypothetical protein VKA43_09440 [Gammaproteobacteria bacterium]|nr:hypothetical protein [Gammaproteobacteria bacterium]